VLYEPLIAIKGYVLESRSGTGLAALFNNFGRRHHFFIGSRRLNPGFRSRGAQKLLRACFYLRGRAWNFVSKN
jgi:hypothetical protein